MSKLVRIIAWKVNRAIKSGSLSDSIDLIQELREKRRKPNLSGKARREISLLEEKLQDRVGELF